MSIGITGRYEVYALLQPIIGRLDINEAARIDNDIRKGYFHTDADAYAYFESKFEDCAVTLLTPNPLASGKLSLRWKTGAI